MIALARSHLDGVFEDYRDSDSENYEFYKLLKLFIEKFLNYDYN